MPQSITYYVQRYRPEFEAISKEVSLLKNHFRQRYSTTIHDLHLDSPLTFRLSRELISFHFLYYPILFPYTYWKSKRSNLNHIYTSLGDLPYLPVLDPKKTILTAAASCSPAKIKKKVPFLQKLPFIIVESERQRSDLISMGINLQKIHLILPPVDEDAFNYLPAKGTFSILYASCPTRKSDFQKRGINLLLDHLSTVPAEKISFTLLWRGGAHAEMTSAILHRKIDPAAITIKNEIIKDMNSEYAQVHATIIPYTEYDDYLKLIPNSAIESLAAGKPVLVSSKTEIARIVEAESCGVVFEPTSEGLKEGLLKLKQNYMLYQRNCRPTAVRYFSQKTFCRKYQQIYEQILKP